MFLYLVDEGIAFSTNSSLLSEDFGSVRPTDQTSRNTCYIKESKKSPSMVLKDGVSISLRHLGYLVPFEISIAVQLVEFLTYQSSGIVVVKIH